mmetsp:Transcript_11179/g.16899  ORF Transcript_11179/g.16899 Transcript_11179/m.16899 type:complete len:217 (-) Transcript_11179:43-693(-)
MMLLRTISLDPSLGRCSADVLPGQCMMELLIDEICDKSRFQTERGIFTDFETWPGVECDGNGSVRKIEWSWNAMQGTVQLQYLPFGITHFSADNNALGGSVSLGSLPGSLRSLSIRNNHLTGSAHLTALPDELLKLDLSMNALSGTVDFTRLPHFMQSLLLNKNMLIGHIDVSRLPPTMYCLDISCNAFVGDVTVERRLEKIFFASGNPNLLLTYV